MLSKNKIKYIQSLKDKKERLAEGVFVAEGNKMVSELLEGMSCLLLIATSNFLSQNPHARAKEIIEVTEDGLHVRQVFENAAGSVGRF